MTTYGPYRRLIIRTVDAIVTITGSNILATVSSCGGQGTPPHRFSFTPVEYGSQIGTSESKKSTDRNELDLSDTGESSSTANQLPLPSSDVECGSQTPTRGGSLRQCPPNSTVTHETTDVDDDSTGIADKCGDADHIGSDTTPSSPVNCDSGSGTIGSAENLCGLSSGSESGKTPNSAISSSNCSSENDGMKPCSYDPSNKPFTPSVSLSSTHSRERPYSCDICGKCFKRRSHVTAHLHTHTRENPYSCEICEKSFSNVGTLSHHIRIHTGEKPYSCDTCGRTFSQSKYLSQHVRTHTGEKPYSCDKCGKTFTQAGSRSRHIRDVHSDHVASMQCHNS